MSFKRLSGFETNISKSAEIKITQIGILEIMVYPELIDREELNIEFGTTKRHRAQSHWERVSQIRKRKAGREEPLLESLDHSLIGKGFRTRKTERKTCLHIVNYILRVGTAN